MEWIQEKPDGTRLHLRITPRASKNEIKGVHDGALKIRLTAAPVDGKANQALIRLISKALRISKSQIEIKQGETGRTKTLRITGITKQQASERLLS